MGQTKGRGRNGRRKGATSIKDIYLYPLVDDLRQHVGVALPAVIPLEAASGLDASSWAEQEFGACDLGDPRRTRRLMKRYLQK